MGVKKSFFGKIKHFIVDDDSIWSWIFDIVIAFILIKFIVYPGLGFLLSTSHPIVAVVSGSMEHTADFDTWWEDNSGFYIEKGITKNKFLDFRFKNGFNKGDIMVLMGKKPKDIELGDVIVYWSKDILLNEPIIHRVVDKSYEDQTYYFQAKGDNNKGSRDDEIKIDQKRLVGYDKYGEGSVAVLRLPYLGWIKILFVDMVEEISNVLS